MEVNLWLFPVTMIVTNDFKKEKNVLFCYIIFFQNQDEKGKEVNHYLFHVIMLPKNGFQYFVG